MGITELAKKVNKTLGTNDVVGIHKIIMEAMTEIEKSICEGKKFTFPRMFTVRIEPQPPKRYNDPRVKGEFIYKPACWTPKLDYNQSFKRKLGEKPVYYESD